MLIKRTLAISLAAALLSATAAMAQTTHTRHHPTAAQPAYPTAAQQRAAQAARAEARDARSSYASEPQQYQSGPYYYEPSDNGSTWSYYPGYTSH